MLIDAVLDIEWLNKVGDPLEIATTICGIVNGSICAKEILKGSEGELTNPIDTLSIPEQKLLAVNDVIQGFGTKSVWLDNDSGYPSAEYIDVGDPYVETILYDYQADAFQITCFADWLRPQEEAA
jgi:hypothetical protein